MQHYELNIGSTVHIDERAVRVVWHRIDVMGVVWALIICVALVILEDLAKLLFFALFPVHEDEVSPIEAKTSQRKAVGHTMEPMQRAHFDTTRMAARRANRAALHLSQSFGDVASGGKGTLRMASSRASSRSVSPPSSRASPSASARSTARTPLRSLSHEGTPANTADIPLAAMSTTAEDADEERDVESAISNGKAKRGRSRSRRR